MKAGFRQPYTYWVLGHREWLLIHLKSEVIALLDDLSKLSILAGNGDRRVDYTYPRERISQHFPRHGA